MPRWWIGIAILLCLLGLVPFVLIARVRGQTSTSPRIAIVQDMGHQPKFRAQAPNALFADGRATRPPVAGSVAAVEPYVVPGKPADAALADDPRYTRGMDGDKFVRFVPVKATKERLVRGQERFSIHCALCHGLAGYGNGMVAVRAGELAEKMMATWTAPASYHTPELRAKESGSLFNAITNGVRTMPPHGSQIGVDDRWNIVMYIRALQRSQYASVEDVPQEKREELR
jgi:mono/diheme cytochrome c family protein